MELKNPARGRKICERLDRVSCSGIQIYLTTGLVLPQAIAGDITVAAQRRDQTSLPQIDLWTDQSIVALDILIAMFRNQ